MDNLPFSEACERNKLPILEVLRRYSLRGSLVEMGFGTAQHCEYFSQELPEVEWYACDHSDYHSIFKSRIGNKRKNLHGPYNLWCSGISFFQQCLQQKLPSEFDYFFTANTLHIMDLESVSFFCQNVGQVLKKEGYLLIYGPFRFKDKKFSASNASFDEQLRARGCGSGIRDYEDLVQKLLNEGVTPVEVIDLPANNNMLVFQKK